MKLFIDKNLPFIQMADLHTRINKLKPDEPEKSGESRCQKKKKLKCKIKAGVRPELLAIDVLSRCKV